MYDCPQCGAPLADTAIVCNDCKWQPVPGRAGSKPPSENALVVAAIRRDYLEHPPSSADLTAQQWYNVCKFFPKIAQRASDYTHRPLADVCPDNPLDRTASRGFLLVIQRRAPRERQPGEEG